MSQQALRSVVQESPTADPAAAVLLDLLDHHVPGVTAHMERTAELVQRVGLWLGVSGPVLQLAVRTAWLHDVGKLKVPSWVLEKDGPLTTIEWALVREHPVLGEQLLEKTPGLLSLAPLVRSTHERWDGEGYPDGLAGVAIPLPSRLVTVCDAFDAMTEERIYRPALPLPRVIWELHKGATRQFDPDIVDALCECLA